MPTLNHEFRELYVIVAANGALAMHRSFEQRDAAETAIESLGGSTSKATRAVDFQISLTDFVKDDVSGEWMPLRLRLAAQWAR